MKKKLPLEAIEQRVLDIIIDINGDHVPRETITLDVNMKNDIDLDSLDAVELLMEIEEAFSIQITDDESEKCETGRDIVVLVDKKLSM